MGGGSTQRCCLGRCRQWEAEGGGRPGTGIVGDAAKASFAGTPGCSQFSLPCRRSHAAARKPEGSVSCAECGPFNSTKGSGRGPSSYTIYAEKFRIDVRG